jgi:hypothetical protein
MRVSDAERSDVADRLARHFGDGRLDQAEFDERISRAMSAKTVADLQGLFDDLPALPGDRPDGIPAGAAQAPGTPSPAAGYLPRRRGPMRGPVRAVLLVALVLVAANVAWHALFWMTPVLWVLVIAALIVVATKRARHSSH